MCWVYKENVNVIYINGKSEFRFISSSPFYQVLKMSNSSNFSMLLGQEPDLFNGDFDPAQSFRGKISEFNLWNVTLSEHTIQNLANCNASLKGNILAWEKSFLTVYGTGFITVDYTNFCTPVKKLVPVFQRLSHDEAIAFCTVHGGYVYTPTSNETNKMLFEVFKNRTFECKQPHTPYLAWLGLEPSVNRTWRYPNDKSIVSYINPYMVPVRKESACALLRDAQRWEERTYSECIKIKICFACQFDNEPIFTVTGFCINTKFNFNFFLDQLRSGEIQYNGYKGNQIRWEHGEWKLRREDVDISKVSPTKGNNLHHPLGRKLWTVNDSMCEWDDKLQQLTISTCKMGKYFTCNSGHCVELSKLCDNVVDCTDASDEGNCTLILPKESYSLLESPDVPGEFKPLWIAVNVIQFDDIDTLKMQLTLTMDIIMMWMDHRIKFANLINNNDFPVATEINGN